MQDTRTQTDTMAPTSSSANVSSSASQDSDDIMVSPKSAALQGQDDQDGEAQGAVVPVPDIENAEDVRPHTSGALSDEKPLPETLKSIREDYGEDLATVASALRIQQKYLAAIEDGDYDSLPGAVYASGWVRSYAHYLGLDGDAAAHKFKEEFTAPKKQMHFYEPVNESRMPGFGVVLISLALLAMAYGAYIYLSAQKDDAQIADQNLPAAVQITQDLSEDPEDANTSSAENEEPVAEENATPITSGRPADSLDTAETPAQVEQTSEAAGTETTNIPADQPLNNAELEASATDAITESAAERGASPTEDTAEGQEDATEEDARDTKTYGETVENVRIVMTAETDSWVQITNAQGRTLFSRVLFAGDRYQVPNSAGLKMRTGNAGGLAIEVDGQLAPSLGPSGSVRSNIKLDPEMLLSGTAYRPATPRPAAQQTPPADSGTENTPPQGGSTPNNNPYEPASTTSEN